MEEGGKEAFCLLLWLANGGQLTSQGRLDPRTRARGLCADPFDCFQCNLMQAEIARHPTGHAIWVCPGCVSDAIKEAKKRGAPFSLPGHFTEGICQFRGCARPSSIEAGVELPAGHSKFLQLFISPINV